MMPTAPIPAASATSIPVRSPRAIIVTPGNGDFVFEVAEGLFAIECGACGEQRRTIDFLLVGETLSSRTLGGFGEIRVRAIESGVLRRRARADWLQSTPPELIARQSERAAWRAILATMAAGLFDVDARVATFLLAFGVRCGGPEAYPGGLAIPVPREDVADHIALNPDTLSRAYTRLRAQAIIARGNRSRPVIRDWKRLAAMSPLASVIEAAKGT